MQKLKLFLPNLIWILKPESLRSESESESLWFESKSKSESSWVESES